MIYDYVILGGGIAGLYTAHQILKKYPHANLLILEKYKTLGGRIYTHHDTTMDVEAGAGRFHSGHTHLLELIRELGLQSKLTKITSTATYVDNSGKRMDSILDAPNNILGIYKFIEQTNTAALPSPEPALMAALDNFLGKENLPNAGIITKILWASKTVSAERLRNQSLVDFAKTVVTEEEVEFLKASFGYYSELVIMNAYDALYLIVVHLSPIHQYYVLKGGLSQLIVKLEARLLKYVNIRILKNRTIERIQQITWNREKTFEISCSNVSTIYSAKHCISALPKQVVESIAFFRPLSKLLSQIKCAPLCRIYSKFPLIPKSPGKKAHQWFSGLPKLTTNNNLRMVIPIDESNGVIMTSYSDNKFAKYWKKLYDTKGIDAVNHELMILLKKTTGIDDIPEPIKTEVFYWNCGVGYWGVGANSEKTSQIMVQPFGPDVKMFLCGEHFSAKNQQWIEGALDTSLAVCSQI
jgi:monoamine oxidase